MQNWQHLFEDKILDRGYFYTDQVKITFRDDKKVIAKVRGTRDYHAEIRFDEGLIDEMFCSCPYFERANCKHLAALFYVLEESNEVDDVKEDFSELFNSVRIDDLKEFLFEELETNDELLNKFKLRFSEDVNATYYKSKLSEICFEEENRYLINDFLSEDIHFLLEKNEYELVFDLLKTVFPHICDWWYYWEDYGSDGNMEEFKDILEILINTEVRCEVFEWLGDLIYSIPNDYHMDDLIDLYFEEFTTYEELYKKEKLSVKLFEKTRDIKWIKIKIDLMGKLNYFPSEIDEFRRQYTSHEEIMQQYIDSTCGSEKEELLKEAINQFEYNEKYVVQLKNYYKMNNDEKYLKVLEDLVFEYPDFEYFKEFKENFTGNWVQKREEIFKKHCDNQSYLNECYAEEELFDLLIKNIHSLWDLNEYREVLVRDYSDELIEMYSGIAQKMAMKSGPPKHYQEIAEILKIIYNLPNGEDAAINLVEDFKREYKRRPRMLQALKNTGFL